MTDRARVAGRVRMVVAAVALGALALGLTGAGPASAAPAQVGSPSAGAPSPFVAIAGFGFRGYWLVQANGEVVNHGHAQFYGSLPSEGVVPNAPIVAIVVAGNYSGYWLVGADGGVYAFGTAHYYGSLGGRHLAHPIVGMTVTGTSKGYSLIDSDGGSYGFGDAAHTQLSADRHLHAPLVAVDGDLEVASDGAVYTLAGAPGPYGSMAGKHLNAPIVGMSHVPFRSGYWLAASDGGIFSFGNAPFFGSMGGHHLNQPIVGMSNSYLPGYWELGADGGVFSFGKATYFGSGATRPAPPAATAFLGLDRTTGAVIALDRNARPLRVMYSVHVEKTHHWPTITQFGLTPDRRTLWYASDPSGKAQCSTIEERDLVTGKAQPRFRGQWVALSPDGTRIAYTGCAPNVRTVYVVDLRDGRHWTAVAPGPVYSLGNLAWTPDGRHVLAESVSAPYGSWNLSSLTPTTAAGLIPWGPTVLKLTNEARLTTTKSALYVAGGTIDNKFSIATYDWGYHRTSHIATALDPLQVVVHDGQAYFVGGPFTGGSNINTGFYRLGANGSAKELRHGIGEIVVYR